MKLLRFYYLNHRGGGHVYVAFPMSVFWADPSAVKDPTRWPHTGHWCMQARVDIKDGERQPADTIRTFKLAELQSVTEVDE